MKPRLVCISANPQSETSLGPEGLSIGRDPSNSIQLEDPTVSSHHCQIEYENNRFVLVDGSPNFFYFLAVSLHVGVAVHTNLRRWNAGVSAAFRRGMTVLARNL